MSTVCTHIIMSEKKKNKDEVTVLVTYKLNESLNTVK
jgi:hypothetical protein